MKLLLASIGVNGKLYNSFFEDSLLRNRDQRVYAMMRHAKSDWSGNRADIERPLKPSGMKDVKRAAIFLIRQNWFPTIVISSPAQRAIETANELITQLGNPVKSILYTPSLYMGNNSNIAETLNQFDPKERPLLIGHNPAFEQWVLAASNSTDYNASNHKTWMPTSCIALLCQDSESPTNKIIKIWRKNDDRWIKYQ